MRYSSCIDCLGPTQEYLVYRDVWVGEAGLDPECGFVCLACLEKRIGRRLVTEDFSPYPCTVYTMDHTLIDRIGAPIIKMYADGTTNVDEVVYFSPDMKVMYREELYRWYISDYGKEWMEKEFVKLPPGKEDDSKRVIYGAIDYPASALAPHTRSLYHEGDQMYRREGVVSA